MHAFVYTTLQLVRISLLIRAMQRVLRFVSGKLFHKSNRKLHCCVCVETETLEVLGEFLTVMQTRDEVEGLHNCREFSQPLSSLYQAMKTRETFSIA